LEAGAVGEQFAVLLFFHNGKHKYARRFVSAQEACRVFEKSIHSVDARLGITDRVVITDSNDCILREWKFRQHSASLPCASRPFPEHWAHNKQIIEGQAPITEALSALADALATRPAEEILFQWFRSGRPIGELSAVLKCRHPDVQAKIDRVYQECPPSALIGQNGRIE
jgi:hypothetical protein